MHTSVLLKETIDSLNIQPGDVCVDGTAGAGGHSSEITNRFGDKVRLIALDADPNSLAVARERLVGVSASFECVEGNFRDIVTLLESRGVKQINRVLFDLGFSSDQLAAGKGFSFLTDEPLLMTYSDPDKALITAYDVVNSWSLDTLTDILKGFGEERFARKIATAIVATRELAPIKTTSDLVKIVMSATPTWYHHKKIHPATRTFQAIRIAVNDEFNSIEKGLLGAFSILAPQGRMAVISFHSSEDRIVKRFMKKQAAEGKGKLITKRPLAASEAELAVNPRSRSAKLRVIEKI